MKNTKPAKRYSAKNISYIDDFIERRRQLRDRDHEERVESSRREEDHKRSVEASKLAFRQKMLFTAMLIIGAAVLVFTATMAVLAIKFIG